MTDADQGTENGLDATIGNDVYHEYVRRLPIAVPTLDRTLLDKAIAGLGATPETVTEEQMLRALRETVFPLLSARGRVATVVPTQARLITTDAANRVRTITAIAATIIGLAPDANVVGQPVNSLPVMDGCVPPVAAYSDAESVHLSECIVPSDARRVQCISHPRMAADGTALGVSTRYVGAERRGVRLRGGREHATHERLELTSCIHEGEIAIKIPGDGRESSDAPPYPVPVC